MTSRRLSTTQAARNVFDMRIESIALRFLIIGLLLLECSFFMFGWIPDFFFKFCNYHVKYLSAMLAIIGAFFALVSASVSNQRVNYLFGVPVITFALLGVVVTIGSVFAYSVNLITVIRLSIASITVPLLYFALHGIVEDDGHYVFFVNAAISVASIYAVVCLVQAYLYGRGIVFMNPDYQMYGMRKGSLRLIMSGDFVSFGAVLAFGRLLSVRNSSKTWLIYAACSLICAFEVYTIAQTRFLVIGLVAVAVIGLFLIVKSRFGRVLLAFFGIIIVLSQFSDQIMAYVFPEELSGSTSARVNGYTYYLQHVLFNGLFGLGFAPSDSIYGVMFKTWGYGNYFRGGISDVGFVGYIARYGVLGIVVFTVGLFYAVRVIKSYITTDFVSVGNFEALLVFAFFIVISPTMAITDSQRIFYLPIMLLLLERAAVATDVSQCTSNNEIAASGRSCD